ncbi:unnamed protein product, partial [Lymnaea stagnalis]
CAEVTRLDRNIEPCAEVTRLDRNIEPCAEVTRLGSNIEPCSEVTRFDSNIEHPAQITRLAKSERILDSSQYPIAGYVLLVEKSVAIAPSTVHMTHGSIAPSTVHMTHGSIAPSTVHMTHGSIAPSTVHMTHGLIAPSTVHMTHGSIAPSTVHMTHGSIAPSTVHMTHGSNGVPNLERVKTKPETNEWIHRDGRIVSKPIYISSSDDETTTAERKTHTEQHYGKRKTNIEQHYGKRKTTAEQHYGKRKSTTEQHYGKRETKRMKTFITDNGNSVHSSVTVTCTQPTYQSCQPVYTVCPVSLSLVQSGGTVPCTQVTYRSNPLSPSFGSSCQRANLRCPDQHKAVPTRTDTAVLPPDKRVLLLAKQRALVGVGVSDNIRVIPTPTGNLNRVISTSNGIQDRGLPTSSGNHDRGLPTPLVHVATSTRNEPELEETFLARNVLKHARNATQMKSKTKPYSEKHKNWPEEYEFTKLRAPAIATPVGVNTARPAPNVIFLTDHSHANKTIYKTSLGLHNANGLLQPNLVCFLDNKDLSITCRKSSSDRLDDTKSRTDPFPSKHVECVKNMDCYPVVVGHRKALESSPSPQGPCDRTEIQYSALDLRKRKMVNGSAGHKPMDFGDDLQKTCNTMTEYPSTSPVNILTSYNPLTSTLTSYNPLTSTSTSAESDFHRMTTPQPCKDSDAVSNRLTTVQPCIDFDAIHTERQEDTIEKQEIESHKSRGLMSYEKQDKRLDTSLTKSLEEILSQRIEGCENTDIKTWLKHSNLTDWIPV